MTLIDTDEGLCPSWAWWIIPVILVLRRLRQKDYHGCVPGYRDLVSTSQLIAKGSRAQRRNRNICAVVDGDSSWKSRAEAEALAVNVLVQTGAH